jgi:hypothetical protein
MTRTQIAILTLLVALVVPPPAMAKTTASISPRPQTYRAFDVCAEDYNRSLTAAELFTIRVLSDVTCFDAPPLTNIKVGWINIAEILDNTDSKSGWAVETTAGGCEEEDLSFDFSELTINGSFLLALYDLQVARCETLLTLQKLDGSLRLVFERR